MAQIAGLRITNDDGIIQIDDQFPCMALRHRGNSSFIDTHPVMGGSSDSRYNLLYRDLTFVAETPILALRASALFGVLAVRRVGNTWTFRVAGVQRTLSNTDMTFEYFVFDKPQVSSTGAGEGLLLWSASGELVFNSDWPIMEVVGVVGTGMGDNDATAYFPSDRKYALAVNGNVTLTVQEDHQTTGYIQTTWQYGFTGGVLLPAPNDSTKVVGVLSNEQLYGGGALTPHGYTPERPAGDLGNWGTSGTLLLIDITRFY